MIFISIVFTVYVLVYFYFKSRFLKPYGLRGRKQTFWSIVLFLFIISPIFSFILFFAKGKSNDLIVTIAFLLFGIVFTIFPYSLVRDFLVLSAKVVRKIRMISGRKSQNSMPSSEEVEDEISRREFLKNSNYTLLALTGFSGVFGYSEAFRGPLVISHEVFIKDLPVEFDGFKIAQISDVHIGPILKGPFVKGVVEKVNSLNPDIVAVTGDLVDGSVDQLKNDVRPLKDLTPAYSTYFITGNHEYYSGVIEWMNEAEELGMKVLLNSSDTISSRKKADPDIVIAGVPDHREGPGAGHEYNPQKAFSKSKKNDIKILLAHQPLSIDESVQAGVNLQLSGHTHGGQFFPWNMGVGLIYPYSAGLYRHNETMWINVNRGTGFWGPPLRLGVPSEITLLTLRKK